MGPAAIPIGVALSAGSLGYGIFAGERARSESARQFRESRRLADQQRKEDQQQLVENEAKQQALFDKQIAEQKATEERLRREQDAALARAKAEVPGIQAQLGEDLLRQQTRAFERQQPQIEARLNALGLLQSGALPEAQAKFQADLEAQRQAALADFGTTSARELNITRPLANSSEDIRRQFEGLRNNLDLAKTNLAQTFANQNAANLNTAAREQYLASLAAANNAAAQSSAGSYLNFAGKLGSGLIISDSLQRDRQQQEQRRNTSLDALYSSRNNFGSPRLGQGAPR